ncbi:MAG: hypothetical protein HDT30_15025 [Clostridiales bacterium]|nr:hypothetical protein [Clostridiales bacterium]
MAATNKPNSDWSLKTVKKGGNGKYEGYGTCNTVDLYSAYYFKGVSKMKISVTNVSSKKSIKVKVYKYGKYWDSCVSTVQVPANGTTTWTISTSSTDKYYVKFFKPADFTWSIEKG